MPPTSRVTVVEEIYYQCRGSQPRCVEGRFVAMVKSEEQLYLRERVPCTAEWKPLDMGWVGAACAMLWVKHEPASWAAVPTPEQRAQDAARIVELGIGGVVLCRIPPGQTARLPMPGPIEARCPTGDARLRIAAFPGDA